VFHGFSLLFMLAGCTTILPGEVGVPRRFGQLGEQTRGPGLVVHSPIGISYVRVPVRTTNIEVQLDIPSKEGLNVRSEVSILYHIEEAAAQRVLEQVGPNYEGDLMLPVFRSAVADVSSRFFAKDMHSGERAKIEEQIRVRMDDVLRSRGFVVEAVLLKSIQLPAGLYAAVETKLAAEQAAQQMEFVLQRERLEAERRVIVATADGNAKRIAATAERDAEILRAEGARDGDKIRAAGVAEANRLAAQGLTPLVLEWRSVTAFEELSKSVGTKVIITDGNTPLLMSP